MVMNIGQISKVYDYLGKTDPVRHELTKTEIENNSRQTANLLLNESMFLVIGSSNARKTELDEEINELKSLFHPAGKLSRVRNMSDKEILEFAKKMLKGKYEVTKTEGKKVTLQSKNIKEMIDSETATHTHEVVNITTKVYINREKEGEKQIQFLIDDIDGIKI